MAVFVALLVIILFTGARIASPGKFQTDYLSKDNTAAVKGLFVLLVFLSHGAQYIQLGGGYDAPYEALKNHLNQMVVAPFWVYSGYGIMESVQKKGFGYVKSIPTRRFFTVLLSFDLAVLLFWGVGALLGRSYDWQTVLWSLIGWKSVGNSNWYIFAALVLYLLAFAAFLPLKWWRKKPAPFVSAALMTALTVAFVYWQMKMHRPGYCYNTLILFPLGMWLSLLKKPVAAVLMRNDVGYLAGLLVLVGVYAVAFLRRWQGIEWYTVWAVAFSLILVMITMKITFGNGILTWFGSHVFSVYILQRIPMMILEKLGVSGAHKYLFLILSLAATMALAEGFDRLVGRITGRLFARPKEEKKTEEARV
ncbi:MAG: acyltransferase family protein [Acutalibacteraceae bacterium]